MRVILQSAREAVFYKHAALQDPCSVATSGSVEHGTEGKRSKKKNNKNRDVQRPQSFINISPALGQHAPAILKNTSHFSVGSAQNTIACTEATRW